MLNTGGDPELERKEIELLFQRQVDGVLHTSMYHRVVEYHRIVEVPEQLRSVPTVLLDARADDLSVPSVGPDEVQGGATAVRELLRHGYRRIGFINNVDDIPAIHGRLEGYRQALAKPASPSVPGWWRPRPPRLPARTGRRSRCSGRRNDALRCSASPTGWRWASTTPPPNRGCRSLPTCRSSGSTTRN